MGNIGLLEVNRQIRDEVMDLTYGLLPLRLQYDEGDLRMDGSI